MKWYWWALIALGVLAVVYFVVVNNNKKQESSKNNPEDKPQVSLKQPLGSNPSPTT